MKERYGHVKKAGAAVAAAGTLALGIGAAEAHAAQPLGKQPVPELSANNPEHRLSIEEATQQAVEFILAGKGVNFYRGSVDIYDAKSGNEKVCINMPIAIYREGITAKQLGFATEHPGSKYWAIGYIQRGVPGNLGKDNLVLLSYDMNDSRFVFHPEDTKVPLKGPTLDIAKFELLKGGGVDVSLALDSEDNLLYDGASHLQVGQLQPPAGEQQPAAEQNYNSANHSD